MEECCYLKTNELYSIMIMGTLQLVKQLTKNKVALVQHVNVCVYFVFHFDDILRDLNAMSGCAFFSVFYGKPFVCNWCY